MSLSTVPFALAVDDQPVIRSNMCSILTDAGFRCHAACDGDEAVMLLDRHASGIILLFSDVEMPGETDGFALARHVADFYPWIEIVIASGSKIPQEGDLPSKATFISKPFSAMMIQNHLREILPDRKKPEPSKQAA